AAAALLAGVALIRPLVGPPTEAARRLLCTAAAAGALGAVAGAAGNLSAGRYLLLPPLLAFASAAVLLPSLRRIALPAGAGLVVWLCWAAVTDSLREAALMLGHVGVATVWAGAVLASATAEPGTRGAVVRRLGPVALAAGALAAVTGVLSARDYDVTLHGITVTDFGTVVVLKVGLLVTAALLGLVVRFLLRRRGRDRVTPRRGGALARLELAVLVAAVVAGTVLTSLPPPGPPPVAGAPLVRALTLDDVTTGLVITPQRPGHNLVHLMTDRLTDVTVAGRRYRAEARPGTQGLWADVVLPAGRSLLEIRQGRQVAAQIVNTGSGPEQADLTGPDGAECASAAMGAVLGGSRLPMGPCPSQSFTPEDALALSGLVAHLHTRGVHQLRLITDATPRGAAAETAIRSAARANGIAVVEAGAAPAGAAPQATLAIAGWEVSQAALETLRAQPAPLYGTYLAPWLVQAGIVAAAGGSPLAALPFDPAGLAAQAYVTALRRIGPGESASPAGLLAFLAAAGEGLPPRDVLLYAATAGFEVMPMAGDLGGGAGHGHGGVDATWFAGGALTPVSGKLA
ncbi:MAG TPA: CopD family protein, partial [Dactylosporangium sp.]|nr:CopD family protein [Dactylosporangium sp.]